MDIKYYIKRPSCKYSTDGRITIEVSNSNGKLFVNWLNLPKNSKLSSGAKVLNNIPAGNYVVEIEDDIQFGKNKKKLTINVPDQDELIFDFVKINHPKCETDYGSIDIFWSGGVEPYKIYCNNTIYDSNKNSLTIDKLRPGSIDLSLEDSLGCLVNYEKIIIESKKINLDIEYIPIKTYGAPCEEFKIILNGYTKPYSLKMLDNINKIIIPIKELTLKNKIYSGNYTLKVIDSQECHKDLSFYISEPKPISVKCSIRADYSYNNYFDYEPINKTYNTIILPMDFDQINEITLSQEIIISDEKNKLKYHQTVISEPRLLQLFSEKYYAIDIATGIPFVNNLNTKYKLIIKDCEYDCCIGLDKRNKDKNIPRLIITNIILQNNVAYKFSIYDILDFKINNNSFIIKLSDFDLINNVYSPNSISSVLYLDTDNYDTIYSINRCLLKDHIFVRSLTQKKIQTKGSIYLNISGGVTFPSGVNINGYKYKVLLFNKNKDIIKTLFTNDYLHIADLDMGHYYIDIRDIGNNTINYYNKNIVYNSPIEIYVPGSIDDELSIMNNQLIDTFNEKSKQTYKGIKKFFRNSNSPSIVFSFSEPKKIRIEGPNNFNKELTVKYNKLSNLSKGTYKIICENKIKNITLFHNSNRIINNI